jgi:hypothetical protein
MDASAHFCLQVVVPTGNKRLDSCLIGWRRASTTICGNNPRNKYSVVNGRSGILSYDSIA